MSVSSAAESQQSNFYENTGIGDTAEVSAFRSRPISTAGQLPLDDVHELENAEERIAQFAHGGKLGVKPKKIDTVAGFASWRNSQASAVLRIAADLLDEGERTNALSASKIAQVIMGVR